MKTTHTHTTRTASRIPGLRRATPRAALLGLLLLAGAPACGSTGATEDPAVPAPAPAPETMLPWTTAFQRPALLVADELNIEGPADLLGHVAIVQDPLNVDYVTKTTEEGLRQVLTVRDGRARVDIRAQLDGWQLVAMKKLVVLQRPGEVPVQVRARGDAWWATTDGTDEVRRDALEFQGERGR